MFDSNWGKTFFFKKDAFNKALEVLFVVLKESPSINILYTHKQTNKQKSEDFKDPVDVFFNYQDLSQMWEEFLVLKKKSFRKNSCLFFVIAVFIKIFDPKWYLRLLFNDCPLMLVKYNPVNFVTSKFKFLLLLQNQLLQKSS